MQERADAKTAAGARGVEDSVRIAPEIVSAAGGAELPDVGKAVERDVARRLRRAGR
jgi:hypothetical protein